jgi:hypothetical protein
MLLTDLREDKHYLMDHPGLVPVTTAQVYVMNRVSYVITVYISSIY